jgi:hypothetical protein
MEVSGQLHAPAALPPGKEPPVPFGIGGWVGPRTVLNAVVKRKIPSPRRESNPRTPIVQPVAQRYTDWAITAPFTRYLVSSARTFHSPLCPVLNPQSLHFPGRDQEAWPNTMSNIYLSTCYLVFKLCLWRGGRGQCLNQCMGRVWKSSLTPTSLKFLSADRVLVAQLERWSADPQVADRCSKWRRYLWPNTC